MDFFILHFYVPLNGKISKLLYRNLVRNEHKTVHKRKIPMLKHKFLIGLIDRRQTEIIYQVFELPHIVATINYNNDFISLFCYSLHREDSGGEGHSNIMENEKRMRREIANSNERRRMQSINAGFQSLRSLLPHHEGEKLSKVSKCQ